MKTRILIVDDEPGITELIKILLESTDQYVVREENSPTNALAAAEEFVPDLMLLDIMMPELDGGELAARFLADERFRHVPLIFLTALVSNSETSHGIGYCSGGRTYLPKSVISNLEQLVDCIEEKLAAACSGSNAAMARKTRSIDTQEMIFARNRAEGADPTLAVKTSSRSVGMAYSPRSHCCRA